MPTYEYRCDNCATNFDFVQSFTDDPLTECPTCGSPVRKVFGSVGIVFKGSGFYKTDSRPGGSGGPSAAVPGESSTPASTESGSGTVEPSSGGKDAGGKEAGGSDSGDKGSGGKNPPSEGKGSGAKPDKSAPSTPAKTAPGPSKSGSSASSN